MFIVYGCKFTKKKQYISILVAFGCVVEVFRYLFFQEVAVQLVARLADWKASAVLVEHFDFLVVEIVTAVMQFAGTVVVVAFDTLKWCIADADSR